MKAKARKRGTDRKPRGPDRVLLVIAALGMALTAYLAVSGWLGDHPAYCGEGSSCDVVQSSRWGSLLGLPVAAWGFAGFAALARVALLRNAETRWTWAWLLTLCGVALSAYLTVISLFHLEAACMYCLGSAGLWMAAFAVVAARPVAPPDFAWRSWLIASVALAAGSVAALHLYHSGISLYPPKESPYLRALAEHLEKSGALFYGSSFCDHCREQKEIFGASAFRLPYIECTPGGRSGPTAAICREAGVRSYPTWVIGGERHLGTLTPPELAKFAGFERPRDLPGGE